MTWPNEAERLVALYRSGAQMTSGERAAAEREIAAQERRRATPPVVRREQITFEASSFKGLDIGYVIAPHLGIEVNNITLEIHRLQPGARTETRRHYEAVCHVLNGRGYTVIDGTRYDWEPHDSFHLQNGARFQHFNLDPERPAHILVAQAAPIIEKVTPHALVSKGDSYSDPPDDFRPEHPFTGERVTVGYVDGEKWMSHLQAAGHDRRQRRLEEQKSARVFLKASDAVIERSQHRGDWKVGLVDRHIGFMNRVLAMYVHQMPPGSHTETHKHGEAIVFVLSGRGHSIVDGEHHQWQAGDCIFVKPGQWHQHFNGDPDRVSQHLAVYIAPLREQLIEGAEVIEVVEEPDYAPSGGVAEDAAWWA
jgi:quercetin dioxygenase-like cupin family protein